MTGHSDNIASDNQEATTMQIALVDNKFQISFDYNPDLVAAVKSLPSRKYNPDNKTWLVPIVEADSIRVLIEQVGEIDLSDNVKALIDTKSAEKVAAIEQSKAASADIEIPCPDGLDYLPYQKAGIQYALGRSSTMIADEMGLGKTIQGIGFANAAESKTVLIVCPASLRLNWLREWEKWDTLGRKAEVVENGKQEFPRTPVVVINYDLLTKFKEVLDINWDLLILDEAHYLKNPKAARTKSVFGYYDKSTKKSVSGIKAARRLVLTGTPILNRPIEAHTILKSINPEMFGNWKNYVTRYCAATNDRYGWDVSGASNLGELQERLRATCMVRRLKADVLKELPAKRRQLIEIQDKAVVKEQKAWAAYREKVETLTVKAELAKCESEEAYEKAVNELNDAGSAAFSEMAKIRHETALAKVPHVIEHLETAIEGGKVICFAHHRDVIAKIKDAFPGCVSITGDTKMEDRQKAVDIFQNDAECKLFVGNIKAAGVGLTLTASSHVIFAELDWVPGNMTQAEDRAHRIGQTDSVLVQHLVLADSLDATIAKRLIEKQAIIDKALDAKVEKDPVMPIEYTETPRKKIEEESINITDEQADKALIGIKLLSSFCDGANSLDGMGFSKVDARIGHSLAGFNVLTKKQAVIAMRLCHKYRRQLEG